MGSADASLPCAVFGMIRGQGIAALPPMFAGWHALVFGDHHFKIGAGSYHSAIFCAVKAVDDSG